MFTVITKYNNVSKVNPLDIGAVLDDTIIIDELGGIALKKGNPITWPTDAKNGMQAIVDVKAGTLRFAYDGWPRAQTEFVVSNYSELFVSVEDSAPAHVLDLIKEWPSAANSPAALPDLPGFKWMFHEGKCWSICGMNGDTELFEGHWLNYHENKKKYAKPFVSLEDGDLSTPVQPKAPVTKEYVMKLIDCWPEKTLYCREPELPEGWTWRWCWGSDWVLTNGVIVLKREDWFKYKFGDAEPAQRFEPFVSVEDSDPATAKQSAPKGKGNPILGMVLADLTNRALEGKEKYGEPLLANNGRNALWDAYQEALDLAMYLRQAIDEQERS